MRHRLGTFFLILVLLAALTPLEAAADGGRHGYRGHHGYHGHRSHLSLGIGFGFGYPYYYSPYYYSPYYYRPYYYGYGPYYRSHYRYYGRHEGALGGFDLAIKPKKAEVWVNGQYVGLARNFDGGPDYLWLPKGTHQLIFYSPGYQTVERKLTAYPGVVIDLKMQLAPGESTPPQELAVPREEPPARRPARDAAAPPGAGGDVAEVVVRDLEAAPGRLRLAVDPADASVYLDGRFLGRGEELAALASGLVIEAGEHLLEVVRPGREPETVAFRAPAGETVELKVELDLEAG